MNTCELQEAAISALVDGELEQTELLPLLDHLVGCASCTSFYEEARALERVVAPVRRDAREPAMPSEAVWEGIRRTSELPEWTVARPGISYWGWKAAAALAVAAGLWSIGSFKTPLPLKAQTEIDLKLEENRGLMTDSRFVQLTSEVLKADRRYHVAMLEVMQEVYDAAGGSEVAGETLTFEADGGDSEGQDARLLPG